MPNSISDINIDLRMVISCNDTARQIITGFSADMPALSEVWHHLQAALADTPVLVTEITALSAALKQTRLDRANLLAAVRATLAAHSEGESDPLWYLRDELDAQDGATPASRRRA